MTTTRTTTRLDKWLWHARFFRSRVVATAEVSAGHVRVNGVRVSKPAHSVGPGDTLTFVQADRIRVVRVVEIGQRRVGAPDARSMYLDLDDAADAPSPLE